MLSAHVIPEELLCIVEERLDCTQRRRDGNVGISVLIHTHHYFNVFPLSEKEELIDAGNSSMKTIKGLLLGTHAVDDR